MYNSNSQGLEFVGVAQKRNRKATVKIALCVAGSTNNLAVSLWPTANSKLVVIDVLHLLGVGPNKDRIVDTVRSLRIDNFQIVGESANSIVALPRRNISASHSWRVGVRDSIHSPSRR